MNERLEQLLRDDPISRRLYEMLPPLRPRPKIEIHVRVEGKIAEAARANPNSVRVSARAADDTHIVGRGVVEVKS
jgi:hypothetical protein